MFLYGGSSHAAQLTTSIKQLHTLGLEERQALFKLESEQDSQLIITSHLRFTRPHLLKQRRQPQRERQLQWSLSI